MKILKAPAPRPTKADETPIKKTASRAAMLQVRPDDSTQVAKIKREFIDAAGAQAGALYSIYESVVDVINREGAGRIRSRYDLGRCFNNAARLPGKSLSALARAIDRPHSFVREHQVVAERIEADELGNLMAIRDGSGFGLDWMHIVALATSLPDKAKRREMAQLAAERHLSVDDLSQAIREKLGQLASNPAQGGGRPFAVPTTLPALIYKAKQQTGSVARYLTDVLAPNLSDLVKDTPPDKRTPEVAALMREFYAQLTGLREMLDSLEPQVREQVEHVEASAVVDGSAVIDVEAVVVAERPARPAAKSLPRPAPAPRVAAVVPSSKPARPAPPITAVRAPGRRPKELDAPGVRRKKV